jgi:hypothetical protein
MEPRPSDHHMLHPLLRNLTNMRWALAMPSTAVQQTWPTCTFRGIHGRQQPAASSQNALPHAGLCVPHLLPNALIHYQVATKGPAGRLPICVVSRHIVDEVAAAVDIWRSLACLCKTKPNRTIGKDMQ